MIDLSMKQQEVVNRLSKLKGARTVTVTTEGYYNVGTGATSTTLIISGGYDGPEIPKCKECGHQHKNPFGGIELIWSNGKFDRCRIHRPWAPGVVGPRPRKVSGMEAGLSYIERCNAKELWF